MIGVEVGYEGDMAMGMTSDDIELLQKRADLVLDPEYTRGRGWMDGSVVIKAFEATSYPSIKWLVQAADLAWRDHVHVVICQGLTVNVLAVANKATEGLRIVSLGGPEDFLVVDPRSWLLECMVTRPWTATSERDGETEQSNESLMERQRG